MKKSILLIKILFNYIKYKLTHKIFNIVFKKIRDKKPLFCKNQIRFLAMSTALVAQPFRVSDINI